MRFEEALVAMRSGRVVRVPAIRTGNSEYFYRIVDLFGLHLGVSHELHKPADRWVVCFVESSVFFREDLELVSEEELAAVSKGSP